MGFRVIDHQKVINLYIIGKSLKEICTIIPCSKTFIHKILKQYNIPTRNIKYREFGKIGRLTPLKYIGGTTSCGHTEVECICDCGKKTTVLASNLRRGNTKSCGCIKVEKFHKLGYGISNLRTIIKAYKRNAKNRNISFELTDDQIKKFFSEDCFYCGSKPSNVAIKERSYGEFIYNGIDRIDSSKGYIIDNCVTCCKRCNYAKNDMTINEFKDWIRKVAIKCKII